MFHVKHFLGVHYDTLSNCDTRARQAHKAFAGELEQIWPAALAGATTQFRACRILFAVIDIVDARNKTGVAS